MTSAQIYDWLQDKFDIQSVAENTVRNYVNHLREHYHIPKVAANRIYGAVDELPPGQQIQVDFGEIIVDTSSGGRQKLYVAGFILSHSRFKYVEWLDRPFRTSDLIRIQENAFHYFGGMTEEIVYDQDRLLAVSENAGDLILTESFTKYHQFRRFKVHHNIKKRPFEVHALEKQHLQMVSGKYHFDNISSINITRTIHKDNVIRFEDNRYSVLLGTYQSGNENIAYVSVTDGKLSISLHPTGDSIAIHTVSDIKGQVITDPGHRHRSQTKRDQLVAQVFKVLDDPELADGLIKTLHTHYPRHTIDQLKIVLQSAKQYPQYINDAVKELNRLRLTSANDLRDIAISLDIQHGKHRAKQPVINEKYKDMTAPARQPDIYLKVLQGGQ